MVAQPMATIAGATSTAGATSPILFFDGECGLCDRFIRFSMANDSRGMLRAAPLNGVTATRLLPPFQSVLANVDSVVLYAPATASRGASVQVYSDAALSVLRLLGGGWSVAGVAGWVVPRWIRDVAYKALAKRRFQIFGRVEACQLWPPEWRARMLP
jgi:predicted DCC family thiol-disulfide oxidoreductase YuxK